MKPAPSLSIGLVLIAAAMAQQPAAAPGLPKLPPQIVDTPRIVRLNVVVQDSHGKFISDLQAGDLRVLDDGKPQDIASFHLFNAADAQLNLALAPREYSNRRAGGAATIILFDLFNADLTERGRGADEIVHALDHLEAADNVYVYLLTSQASLFAVHGFPEPGSTAEPDARWPRHIKPMLDDALHKVLGMKPLIDQLAVYRIPPTWMALENLASGMAAIPGRKNFVWITQGVPNGYIDISHEQVLDPGPLRLLAARFNQMDTVAYAVQQRINESIPSAAPGSEKDTLDQLTGLTGGREYPADNTAVAINQAIADARMYYRVVYSPPAKNWNGKYHKIRVTSARKELRIQTLQSYFASTEPLDKDDEYVGSLRLAAAMPLDSPEIGLRAAFTPGDSNPQSLRVRIHIDPSDVAILQENGRYKGQLVVTAVEYGPGGLTGVVDPLPVVLNLTPEDYQKVIREGIEVTEQLPVDSRMPKVRIVVLDITANVTGTLTAALSGTP